MASAKKLNRSYRQKDSEASVRGLGPTEFDISRGEVDCLVNAIGESITELG